MSELKSGCNEWKAFLYVNSDRSFTGCSVSTFINSLNIKIFYRINRKTLKGEVCVRNIHDGVSASSSTGKQKYCNYQYITPQYLNIHIKGSKGLVLQKRNFDAIFSGPTTYNDLGFFAKIYPMDKLFLELSHNIEELYYKIHYGNNQTTFNMNTQTFTPSFHKQSSKYVPRRNFEQPFHYPPPSFLDVSSNHYYMRSASGPMYFQKGSLYSVPNYNPSQYWTGDTSNRVSF